MSEKLFVSAQQVAERAGVSRSAVSRTFTPGASVSTETRRRVLEAAEVLGYHVNELARGLMRNESGIVCLIVSDVATPYRSALLRELTLLLQNAGKVAMLINTDRSDGSVDRALRQAIRYRADASIMLSGMPDKSIAQLCLRSGQRLVLINRDDDQPGPLRINLDDDEAAGRVVTAFVRAGCRKLAFANSEAGTPSLMARERGFVAAANALGIKVFVERHGWTGYEAGKVLAQRMLTRTERPDAVFCATDLLACGIHGRRPPPVFDFGARPALHCRLRRYRAGLMVFLRPDDLRPTGFSDSFKAVEWLSRPQPQNDDAISEQSIRLHAELVWRGLDSGVASERASRRYKPNEA